MCDIRTIVADFDVIGLFHMPYCNGARWESVIRKSHFHHIFAFVFVLKDNSGIMRAFVFAMEKEASPVLSAVTIKKTERRGYATFHECVYQNVPFLVVISGVGKAFAAASIATMMEHYHVDSAINFGVAGTTNGNLAPIGSAVISSACVEHDLDTSAVGDPVGLVSGINIVEIPCDQKLLLQVKEACKQVGVQAEEGLIASGDTFFLSGDPRKQEVIQRWNPLCVDMESAPCAQIAYVYHVGFVSVRLISDWMNPSVEYDENVPLCVERIKNIALRLLQNDRP